MENKSNSKVATKINDQRQLDQENELSSSITSQIISKQEISQVISSQYKLNNSPVKKVLTEANKIIKIGMEKEVALFEKDTTIQNSRETIDNLKRNIIKLQMEYEKLDRNYQNEISHRSDITKRMDTTREIVESTTQFSNILAKSVKQLEEDKFRLAEFYELIIGNQKNVEEKHNKINQHLNDIDNLLNDKITEIKTKQEKICSENAEKLAQRDRELSMTNEKLNNFIKENEILSKTLSGLKTSHSIQQNSIEVLKLSIENIKRKNIKKRRLWITRKRRMIILKKKLKDVAKSLKDTKSTFSNLLSSQNALEIDNSELRNQLKELNAVFQTEKQKWIEDKEGLCKALSLKDLETIELTSVKGELQNKITEFEKKATEWFEKEEKVKEFQLQLLEENQTLKKNNAELNQQNFDKNQLILDFESKLKMYDGDYRSKSTQFRSEIEKYEETLRVTENKLTDFEKKISVERNEKETLIAQCKKAEQKIQIMNDKVVDLEKLLSEKNELIDTYNTEKKENMAEIKKLQAEIDSFKKTEIQKDDKLANLDDDYRKIMEKNECLMETLKNEGKNIEVLTKELEKSQGQVIELNKKLREEDLIKKTLLAERNQLKVNIEDYIKKIEENQKVLDELKLRNNKLEEELASLRKVSEENSDLKISINDLKSRLEGAETRVEALKVIIKKLENEKIESKEGQYQEITRLRTELTLLRESVIKEKELQRASTPNFIGDQTNRETDLREIRKFWEKVKESSTLSPIQKLDNKDNDPVPLGIVQTGSVTPIQSGKKFISTPRKVLTSTPQSRLQSLTPAKKKRDPYEFDSDGSVERLDPNEVLKVFGSRPKKDSASKKPKTKNI